MILPKRHPDPTAIHPSQTELLASVGDGGRGGCSPGARPGQASQTLGIRPVAREKREAATAYPTLWDRNPSKPPISSSSASRACSILSQPVRFPKRATSWPTSSRPAARSRSVPAGRRRRRGRRADRLAGVPLGQFADDVGNALRSSRCVGERVPAGGGREGLCPFALDAPAVTALSEGTSRCPLGEGTFHEAKRA